MIKFACPHCAAPLSGSEERIGTRGRCPKCTASIVMEQEWITDLAPAIEKPSVESRRWLGAIVFAVGAVCIVSCVGVQQNLDAHTETQQPTSGDDSHALSERLQELETRLLHLENIEARITALEQKPERFLVATWRIDELAEQLEMYNGAIRGAKSIMQPSYMYQVIDDGQDFVRDGVYREQHGTYGTYRNGQRHGRWVQYQLPANGKSWPRTRAVGEFVNGKRSGLWVFSNSQKGEWTEDYAVVTPYEATDE